MIDDDFDDIFKLMDRIFSESRTTEKSPLHTNSREYERLMDEDYIYYTFQLTSLEKDAIDIKPFEDYIVITITDSRGDHRHNIKLPYPIIPEDTKVTFKNGILDITVKINKEKANKIEIE